MPAYFGLEVTETDQNLVRTLGLVDGDTYQVQHGGMISQPIYFQERSDTRVRGEDITTLTRVGAGLSLSDRKFFRESNLSFQFVIDDDATRRRIMTLSVVWLERNRSSITTTDVSGGTGIPNNTRITISSGSIPLPPLGQAMTIYADAPGLSTRGPGALIHAGQPPYEYEVDNNSPAFVWCASGFRIPLIVIPDS